MSGSKTGVPYYKTDHGAEIYPRRLKFTAEEKSWRNSVVNFLMARLDAGPEDYSWMPPGIQEIARADNTEQWLRGREDRKRLKQLLRDLTTEILSTLRVINSILQVWFGSPNWGNQPHVIDELVFILLNRRSKIEDAIRHLAAIRDRFADWDAVADATPQEIREIILGGGLEDRKVESIQAALNAIRRRFGRIDEGDLDSMPDDELERFLQSLPGVGPKSSDCVLMYARGRDIFPSDTHCIRALTRLGIFAPIGYAWTQGEHKRAERELRILVPPHMRSDLHRNLIGLGRSICTSGRPRCTDCELRKFCQYYRNEQQKLTATPPKPTAIDAFSGAGGFSLGLEQAGFKVIAAIDNDPDALRTYRLNHPHMRDQAVIDEDTRYVDIERLVELLDDRRLDLLVGGPPCQGFSSMGNRVPHKFNNGDKRFGADYRFEDDERNLLFQAMLRFAEKLEPRYVVIENVPGLGTAEIQEKSFAEFIAERLRNAKYDVKVLRLEAADFGIPQRRHRYFIVGIRCGEVIPDLERLARSMPETDQTALKYALFDLPSLRVADGHWVAAHNDPTTLELRMFEPYLGQFGIRGTTRILYNHVTRYNNDDDVTLYAHLEQGETYFQLLERLMAEAEEKPAFAKYDAEAFKDKYFRLDEEGQSKTIVSHLKKDGNSFVHPTQTRSLSVREAARIQSFPDDYIFCGSRGPQFVQIGNAVPPVMARIIGGVLLDVIEGRHTGEVARCEEDAE